MCHAHKLPISFVSPASQPRKIKDLFHIGKNQWEIDEVG